MQWDGRTTTCTILTEFMRKKGDSAFYRYDYGDGWKLEVVLEGILPREKNKPYPICLGGRLSGPPEDCGGIHGYYRCIEAIANQDNTDGLLTWLGDWRPDDFDPNQIVFETPEKRFERATQD